MAPVLRREDTQTQLLDDLLDRAFGGSATQLVLRALNSRKATPTEIEELRKMLDRIERQGEKSSVST
ncbi:MAG: BlaI/MecI/CopY family transcriptional regulator [Bryobacteraceae bacterium]|nr:BlaI/MecI/CopY family transcriptional regulator [Bryobacteraceae bacterium]